MAFDRWGSGFEELEGLDLRRYMPDWDNFIAGVETCFEGVDRHLSGQPALHDRKVPALPLDERALGALSHFQRAAVVSCRDRVLAIGSLAAAIFAVAYIFSDPRAALTRGMWMTLLVLIMGADNQQFYSFLVFANWFLVGLLFVTFMAITWRCPRSSSRRIPRLSATVAAGTSWIRPRMTCSVSWRSCSATRN